MASTLRDLLLQRAARLQGRPALTAPGWGTLSHAQLRHRAEGVALGLLAAPVPPVLSSATGSAWDWAAELAAAATGLAWGPEGQPVPPEVLGGTRFNDEVGRGPYHGREAAVTETTLFHVGLGHGQVLARLRRLNLRLGWDHDTWMELPLPCLGEPALRAALWSLLYAGGHAVLLAGPWPPWDPSPFREFWDAEP